MPHPGLLLDKLRKAIGLTKVDLASKCELKPVYVNTLCRGSVPMTLYASRMLEREGLGNSKQWMKLQEDYDELLRNASPEQQRHERLKSKSIGKSEEIPEPDEEPE